MAGHMLVSPKSDPKHVNSLLRPIAGIFSSSSYSSNFPNCFSPKESASVYADYLLNVGKIFYFFKEASQIMSFSLANFACLQIDWASICLSHKNGGIPLSVLPKDTTSMFVW